MAEEQEKKKSGWLKKSFGGVAKIGFMVASFAVAGYLGSMVFDYGFLPVVHDTSNPTTLALLNASDQVLRPIHEFFGLVGDGGIANSHFVQETLGFKDFYPADMPQVLAQHAQNNNVNLNDMDAAFG